VAGEKVRLQGGERRVKKPPVFIGLGAVYNRNLNTLFRNRNPLGFSEDWIKKRFMSCFAA
jgi:5,10-methylenetetrahydrofolate reductase